MQTEIPSLVIFLAGIGAFFFGSCITIVVVMFLEVIIESIKRR